VYSAATVEHALSLRHAGSAGPDAVAGEAGNSSCGDAIRIELRLAGGESRDYLEIRRDLFTGFISCFGYGQDLYLGWTFWLRISPSRYLLMGLARSWQTLMRRGTDLYVTLRFDYARAMREAMHSVAREGADVAVGLARPQGQGTVGTTVPVTVSEIYT